MDEAAAQILEMELSNLKLIIIDEKSMMGKARLHVIDRRLRQARPAKKDTAFGGISIMIAGDFRQLPPVGDSPLYERTPGKTEDEIQGGLLYTLFDKNTFVLSQQMCHRDPRFIDEMNALGNNTFNKEMFNTK